MKYKVRDFEEYTNSAPSYANGLLIIQSGIEDDDVNPMVMKLRRTCDSSAGLSFMLVTSSNDSKKPIYIKKVRNGKRGRPKTIVQGQETDSHFHILIINTCPETDINAIKEELRNYCKCRRKKRPNLKRQKITDAWSEGLPIVSYMVRQMNETKPYTHGTFNFQYFANILYCKYPDEDVNYDNILDF